MTQNECVSRSMEFAVRRYSITSRLQEAIIFVSIRCCLASNMEGYKMHSFIRKILVLDQNDLFSFPYMFSLLCRDDALFAKVNYFAISNDYSM